MKVNFLLFVLIAFIVGAGAGYYFGYDHGFEKATLKGINTFEECEQAGYPVQESFPRGCTTPDKRTYFEKI